MAKDNFPQKNHLDCCAYHVCLAIEPICQQAAKYQMTLQILYLYLQILYLCLQILYLYLSLDFPLWIEEDQVMKIIEDIASPSCRRPYLLSTSRRSRKASTVLSGTAVSGIVRRSRSIQIDPDQLPGIENSFLYPNFNKGMPHLFLFYCPTVINMFTIFLFIWWDVFS